MALTIDGGITIEGGISITAQPYQLTTSVTYEDTQTSRADYQSSATIHISSSDYTGMLYCSSEIKRFGFHSWDRLYGTLELSSSNPVDLSSGSADVVVYAVEIPELNEGGTSGTGTLKLNFSETETGPVVKTQSVAVSIWVQI